MDGIFGRDNFINEIIWHYTGGGRSKKYFSRKHDVLFWYSKMKDKQTFNIDDVRVPYKKTSGYAKSGITSKAGKHYQPNPKGTPVDDVWDIPIINPNSNERMGYPTQKPLQLLDRIITASSNKGDLILDPFCGCGTTIEAAQKLNRKWIGIDISGNAVDEIKRRLEERLLCYEDIHYSFVDGSLATMAEYHRLNPYEKQDWLIRRLGGMPNQGKSGDGSVDGDMTIHLGVDGKGKDKWGKLVFAVNTGSQKNPAQVRKLKETMGNDTQIGVFVLDTDPSTEIEETARKAGTFNYQIDKNALPKEYRKIQIITISEVIAGAEIDRPPTMQEVQEYREKHGPGKIKMRYA